MEKEINYLSIRISKLDFENNTIQGYLNSGLGVGGRIGKGYRETIIDNNLEKELLTNILNKLTEVELEN